MPLLLRLVGQALNSGRLTVEQLTAMTWASITTDRSDSKEGPAFHQQLLVVLSCLLFRQLEALALLSVLPSTFNRGSISGTADTSITSSCNAAGPAPQWPAAVQWH